MKKRNIKKKWGRNIVISIILILIIIFLFFIAFKFTGKVINSEKFICSDSDGGKNPEFQGIVKQGEIIKGTDYCTNDIRLKEYYCLTKVSTTHYYYNCPYKCLEGKCVE